MNEPDRDRQRASSWQRRRQRDMEEAGILEGRGHLYRAGELLCSPEAEERLRGEMQEAGGRGDAETNDQFGRVGVDVRRWVFPRETDMPSLIKRLRAISNDDWATVDVAVNTVFAGEPKYHGGPGGPPSVAPALKDEGCATPRTQVPGIGVLDTGYGTDTQKLHSELFGQLRPDRSDVDLLDINGDGVLDAQAGHGTFICGLVRRLAPEVVIDPERVLDARGWGDDVSVTLGLAEQKASVLNLSLGGYTEDDRPPMALARALRKLGPDVVVIAAAGNNASDRPFWPAAFKKVIAVAALDTTDAQPRPADFSNYGWWVDVCAPGVNLHSSYVRGVWRTDAASPVERFTGWASWSGTSFAAPVVAATVAAKAQATGAPARQVAAELLAGLKRLPGAEDYGVVFDPGVDLVSRGS